MGHILLNHLFYMFLQFLFTVVEVNFELSFAVELVTTVITRQISNISMYLVNVLVQGGSLRKHIVTDWANWSFYNVLSIHAQ